MLYSKRLQTPKTVGSSVVKMHTLGMGSTAGTLTFEEHCKRKLSVDVLYPTTVCIKSEKQFEDEKQTCYD